MKKFIFMLLMAIPFVIQGAVQPSDTLYVNWSPHPQHSTTPSESPARGPITIHVVGRTMPTGTDLNSDPSAYVEWGTAPGDASLQVNGKSAIYGEELQIKIYACWDDPTTPNVEDINCSGRSVGFAYVVPLGAPGIPTGLVVTVNSP